MWSCLDFWQVLKLLRASLTSTNVLSDVFSKPLRETFEGGPHRQDNEENDHILVEDRGEGDEPVVAPLKESIQIARDWGRGLYIALREVQDAAFHSSLLNYVRQREHRITSALRDLNTATTAVETTTSSRSSSCGNGGGGRKSVRKRGDGEYVIPASCKEMLMLEKQVDKVMARLCHLTSEHGESLDPSSVARPKSAAAAAAVKPPWTLLSSSPRVRLPSRVWHP